MLSPFQTGIPEDVPDDVDEAGLEDDSDVDETVDVMPDELEESDGEDVLAHPAAKAAMMNK